MPTQVDAPESSKPKTPGFAGGGNNFDVGESGVASELRHVFGALRKIAIFGGDGWQSDPVLKALHVFVVELGDLAEDGLEIGIVRGGSECRNRQRIDGDSGKSAADEFATIERRYRLTWSLGPLSNGGW